MLSKFRDISRNVDQTCRPCSTIISGARIFPDVSRGGTETTCNYLGSDGSSSELNIGIARYRTFSVPKFHFFAHQDSAKHAPATEEYCLRRRRYYRLYKPFRQHFEKNDSSPPTLTRTNIWTTNFPRPLAWWN